MSIETRRFWLGRHQRRRRQAMQSITKASINLVRIGLHITYKRMVEDLQSEQRQLVSAAELRQQLQASQEIIKELEADQRLAGVNFENQQLRDEIENLQNQLQTSEIQPSKSAWQNQEAAEHYAQLQNEIVELKQQAEEGQRTARELEAVQEQLGVVESREKILKEQQLNLEARIKNSTDNGSCGLRF